MWNSVTNLMISTTRSVLANQGGTFTIQARTNFFDTSNSGQLWKAVTSVSNQGRMRGRAKGLMRYKDLHKGQRLGWGKSRILFPGLGQSPINMKNKEKVKITKVDQSEYEAYRDEVIEIQNKSKVIKSGRRRQTPLERGWTSASQQGRVYGAPDSKNPDDDFSNFESCLIEHRGTMNMTSLFGRVRFVRILMVTGNRDGLCGYTLLKAPFGTGIRALRRAVNRAGNRVCFIDRYEDRTVFHDFYTAYGNTRIFVRAKPPGHGIVAHRIIKSMCELIGIKDLHAGIEGSLNPLHVAKAFYLGLLRQRTHQALANEKKLHLVEFREETGNFPTVVASPEDGVVRSEAEIGKDEVLDFQVVSFDGNLPAWRSPFFTGIPMNEKKMRKIAPTLHHHEKRLRSLVEEGEVRSFLTDKYPEAIKIRPPKAKQSEE